MEMYGVVHRRPLGGMLPPMILCAVFGLALGGFICTWLNIQFNNIIREVHLETGTPVSRMVFFNEDVKQARILTDLSKIDTMTPATYQINISLFGKKVTSVLEISDTTPPTGVAIPQTVMANQAPDVNDTVKALADETIG